MLAFLAMSTTLPLLLAIAATAEGRMSPDSIIRADRSRKIGERSYPVPRRSTSALLDTDTDSYLVTDLPYLPKHAFPTRHWAGDVPIPYAGQSHDSRQYSEFYHI